VVPDVLVVMELAHVLLALPIIICQEAHASLVVMVLLDLLEQLLLLNA